MVVSSSLSNIVDSSVVRSKSSSVVVGIMIVVGFGDDVICGFLVGKRVNHGTIADWVTVLVNDIADGLVVLTESFTGVDDGSERIFEIKIHSGKFWVVKSVVVAEFTFVTGSVDSSVVYSMVIGALIEVVETNSPWTDLDVCNSVVVGVFIDRIVVLLCTIGLLVANIRFDVVLWVG